MPSARILVLFSVVGAYASRNAPFDVYLMLVCGAVCYLMKRTGYSPAATVMGVILSPIADNELIRMFQLYGSDWYLAFVTRPIAASILVLLIATLAWSAFSRFTARRQRMLSPENGATQ